MEQAAVQWDERMQHHTPATRPPMPLPLIRLRVHYDTQIPLGNLARFGQEFVGRVANPKELLQLQLRRERQRRDNTARPSVVPWDQRMAPAEKLERVDLASLVMDHIRVQQFDLLNASQLQKSVIGYVEKEEREAIETFVNQTLQSVERQLSSRHMQESQIQEALEQLASHPIAMEAPSEAPSSQDSMYEEMRPSAPASPSPPPPPRRPTRGRTATQSAVPATPHTASRSAVLGSSSSTDVSTTSPSRPARRRRRVDSSF
ncbi:mitotic G2 DNA damage checkpoint signaling protein [Malassezia pachydermatis]